ncbi:MAG: phosphoribosylanthranilate isomerase [Janthinobacterium lividum]
MDAPIWIKICGTTNLPDAQLSVALGADALGFIFAPSKRRIDIATAAGITSDLPKHIETVGVFTEADKAEIIPAVQQAGLSAVQLHMAHDLTLTHCLHALLGPGVRLIQVIPFYTGTTDEEVIRESFEKPLSGALADPAVWAVLLDTAKDGRSGGLGETFSWRAALPAIRSAQERALEQRRGSLSGADQTPELPKLLLAGGLQADNVPDAIGVLEPWGVDVVSGVEAGPGHKDPTRLAAFMAAARKR